MKKGHVVVDCQEVPTCRHCGEKGHKSSIRPTLPRLPKRGRAVDRERSLAHHPQAVLNISINNYIAEA